MSRVSDAQCLAAYHAADAQVQLFHKPPHIVIYDMNKSAIDREIWRGTDKDVDAAQLQYQIEVMRPILTAALNIN